MYQENEDDWKILKEYKQQRRNKIAAKRDDAVQVGKRVRRKKPLVEKEIASLEASIASVGSVRKKTQLNENLRSQKKLLADLSHDIAKADELEAKYNAEIDQLNREIDKIDKKIKALRRKENEQNTAAAQGKQDPVQKCPKKCRISDIVIGCKHKKTLEVPPFECEVPTLHVLSGSASDKQDIVDVTFGGSCDHGKSQSAGDSEKYQEKSRAHGAEQYCPRVVISNATDGTDISRPSKTRFLTQTEEFVSNATPTGFLINDLIFNKNNSQSGSGYDAVEYDLGFESCQGSLPYKALVVAHPKCSWKVAFNFGYEAKYEKHIASRQFAKNEVKNFDTLKANGKWKSSIKGSYEYDVYKDEIELQLDFNTLLQELGGSWPVLEKLSDFLKPINGLVESALGYSEGAEEKYDKTLAKAQGKEKLIGKKTTYSVDVKWPKLKLSGEYKRVETEGNQGIAGQGSVTMEFAPLFGIEGKIDIIQLLLQTLGGGFGVFLRKVADMSVGYKNDDGSTDKSRSYIETNIELFFGAESTVSGALGFDSTVEKGWHASAKGTKISGFIGLILEGKAKVEGKLWVVKIGAGAEFKTTDESGNTRPGIEVSYKPAVIDNKFSWAGTMDFLGLAVTWALYYNTGAEGLLQDSENGKKSRTSLLKKTNIEAKREMKDKGNHILLNKKTLFGKRDVTKIGT